MVRPRDQNMHEDITIANYVHPDASHPLILTMRLACNVGTEIIAANVTANSAREDLPWMRFQDAHDGVAVLVGGGPSAADDLDTIAALQKLGCVVFGLNGASSWLRGHGICPDIQIILDARPENIDLLDRDAPIHMLASQVDPALVTVANNPVLMHLATVNVEDHLPAQRKARGDYALLGGGYGVGNTAVCAAYVTGYRVMHCFGFDSSHRDGCSHSYTQPMNDGIACVETEWEGRTYLSSLPMKAHAGRFQEVAGDLQSLGCEMHVHGDGLLPAMWNSRKDNNGKLQ